MPTIPPLLDELIAAGRWPVDAADANRQHLHPRIDSVRVARIANEGEKVYLYPPPFETVKKLSESNRYWLSPDSDPSGIDFKLAVMIADFGMGSDSPILLDYRFSTDNPHVIRLQWSCDGGPNRWVPLCDSFESFVKVLGI